MTEQWKPIQGYEEIYMISENGDVYSNYKKRNLHPNVDHRGYKVVSLCKDHRRKVVPVHRLVAQAFIENAIKGYAEVNHKDGNKTNNAVENLEWVTKGENLQHAYRVLDRKTVGKSIRCVDTGAVYASAAEAERKTGINSAAIRQVLCGIKQHAGGRQWERA